MSNQDRPIRISHKKLSTFDLHELHEALKKLEVLEWKVYQPSKMLVNWNKPIQNEKKRLCALRDSVLDSISAIDGWVWADDQDYGDDTPIMAVALSRRSSLIYYLDTIDLSLNAIEGAIRRDERD